MKSKLSLLLLTLLTLCVASPTYAQANKAAQKPHPKKRVVIHDAVTLEKFIFDHLGLTASQKARCNSLLATMMSQVKGVMGSGLAPHLQGKADAKRLKKIQKDYTDGLRQILTLKQRNQYALIHKEILTKLQQRGGGMHF
jgi:Spy/CpxP family protein refolding chaperone